MFLCLFVTPTCILRISFDCDVWCVKQEHMIQSEVSLLRRVKHPNIVLLIEEIDTQNDLYLVMELVKVLLQHNMKSCKCHVQNVTLADSAFFREGTSLMPSPPPTSTQSGTPAVCSSTWPAPSSTCTAWISSTGTSSPRTCWWVRDWSCSVALVSLLPESFTDRYADNLARSQQKALLLLKFQPCFTLITQRLPTHPFCKLRNRSGAALIC